jgi:hypothetical protein
MFLAVFLYYLEEPFHGARTQFTIENVPLSAFDPEIRQINIAVGGGRLFSSGLLEYSPKVTRVQVDNATIEGVSVGYVHAPATQQAEARRVKAAGKEIEKQNNRRAVEIEVHEFDITHSNFSYTDKTKDPSYRLFFNNTDLALKNLSNHQQQGPADLTFHGKLMGSGDIRVSGDYLASQHGPTLNIKLAIRNANLPSMNDMLRAYGRFDVAAGRVSVFSEVNIKDVDISGYVKPMFANLEVYNYEKDKEHRSHAPGQRTSDWRRLSSVQEFQHPTGRNSGRPQGKTHESGHLHLAGAHASTA